KGFLGADLGKGDDAALTLGAIIAQQGGLAEVHIENAGATIAPPSTNTVPQDGTYSPLFQVADSGVSVGESMKVKNYP
ncbi:hypothetical protein ACI3PL_32110, partial [Lacticaseibacillus paracasei]